MTAPEFYKRPSAAKRAYLFTSAYAKRYSGQSLVNLLYSKLGPAQRAAEANTTLLTEAEAQAALALPDNSDLSVANHAVGLITAEIIRDLEDHLSLPIEIRRSSPLISPADNYLNLGFDRSAVARDRKHANYLSEELMLRTHMSSSVPSLLRSFMEEDFRPADAMFALPGRVFRRDVADKTHLSHPHQMDFWRFSAERTYSVRDMESIVGRIVNTIFPGADWRMVPGSHPYLSSGRQVDIWFDGQWLEIGECGLQNSTLYRSNGVPPRQYSGIGMGFGLERAVMIRKNITDIRYVDSAYAPILEEMQTLNATDISYLPRPAFVTRLRLHEDEQQDLETLGDSARNLLGTAAQYLESVTLLHGSETKPLEVEVKLSAIDGDLTHFKAETLFERLRRELAESKLALV